MWDRLYEDWVCPMPLAGDLDLMWMPSCLSFEYAGSCNLGRGGVEDGGARAGTAYEAELHLCSVAITVLSGVRSEPMLLEQKLCASG